MEIITYRQYDSAIKRQVNKNLKLYGKSTAECTMQDTAKVIREVREDEKTLFVVDGWRNIIKLIK